MISNEQQSQELIIRNEYLNNKISELLKIKREYEEEKRENNNRLRKLCKHNWVRDKTYEFHNEKIYECSKCKLIS